MEEKFRKNKNLQERISLLEKTLANLKEKEMNKNNKTSTEGRRQVGIE